MPVVVGGSDGSDGSGGGSGEDLGEWALNRGLSAQKQRTVRSRLAQFVCAGRRVYTHCSN